MHDKFGRPLKEGDLVLVPAVIKTCHASEEYCNVTLETLEPMYPSDRKDTLTLNAKQVVKGAIGTVAVTD